MRPRPIDDNVEAQLQNMHSIAIDAVKQNIHEMKLLELEALRRSLAERDQVKTVRRMLEASLATYQQVAEWTQSVQLWYTTEEKITT